MTVITLSRQFGSQGEEIAAVVAQRLGLRLVDASTINLAAQRAGVPEVALAEIENEGERGLANRVLNALRTMPTLRSSTSPPVSSSAEPGTSFSELRGLSVPFSGLFSPTVPPISASLEGHVRMVGLVIRGLAHEGDVLIVGRGGQALLKKHPTALHVQIVAPQAQRVGVVMKRQRLDKRSAESRIRTSDRARLDYVRRYHGVNWLDSTLYHLVVNTGCMTPASAASLVISAHAVLANLSDGIGDNAQR